MTGKISDDSDRVVDGTEKFAAAVGGSNFGILGSSIATYLASLAQTLTNKTINAASNTISNLTTSMFAASVVDVDGTFAANSDTRLPSQKAVKTATDALSSSLSSGLAGKVGTSAIDTDPAFAANSDSKIPSQKAVKTAMDALVIGGGGVAGPGASTDGGFARWDGTGGTTLKDGAATVALGSEVSGTLPVANGGTGYTGGAFTNSTPTPTTDAGAFSGSPSSSIYTLKIGRLVFCTGTITTGTGRSGATLQLTLPYAAGAASVDSAMDLTGFQTGLTRMNNSSAVMSIYKDGFLSILGASAQTISFSILYMADS